MTRPYLCAANFLSSPAGEAGAAEEEEKRRTKKDNAFIYVSHM